MRQQQRETAKDCYESQVNRHVPDFHCNMKAGHSDAHRDPDTGTRWGHRQQRKVRK